MRPEEGRDRPGESAAHKQAGGSAARARRSQVSQGARERLLSHGALTLADSELLGLVLGAGMPGRPAREIAENLLALGPGLKELCRREARELVCIPGVGPARAAQLAASLELGRRAQLSGESRPRLRTPAEIYAHLSPALRALRKEVFHVLSFNARNVLLNDSRVAEGSMDACPVDPREVFSAAIAARATAIVLAHNHPSGDPEPSEVDVTLTDQLAEGGRILGIRVLDHIVIGDGAFVSLLDRGRMRARPSDAGAWAARRFR